MVSFIRKPRSVTRTRARTAIRPVRPRRTYKRKLYTKRNLPSRLRSGSMTTYRKTRNVTRMLSQVAEKFYIPWTITAATAAVPTASYTNSKVYCTKYVTGAVTPTNGYTGFEALGGYEFPNSVGS